MFASALAVTITGPFVFGLLLALLSGLKADLARQSSLREEEMTGLFGAINLSLIPTMFLAGLLTDQFGPRMLCVLGAILTALAIAFFAACTSYAKVLMVVILAGLGGSCVSAGSTVLMNNGFFANNSAASQNMGNIFFGVGVLFAPGLTNILIRLLGFRRAVMVLGMICLLPAVACLFTTQAAFVMPRPQSPEPSLLAQTAALPLLGVLLMLYLPTEWSLGMSDVGHRFLADCRLSTQAVHWCHSIFWLMFLGGRLAMGLLHYNGWLPKGTGQTWFLVGLGLTTAVFLGNMLNSRSASSGVFGYLMVGLFLGPIFPTLTGICLDLAISSSHQGSAYGCMFSLGSLGNLFLLPMFRHYSNNHNPHQAMLMPMVIAIVFSAVALFFGLGWGER